MKYWRGYLTAAVFAALTWALQNFAENNGKLLDMVYPYVTRMAQDMLTKGVMGMGMNKFAADAPVLLVLSEEDYVASAAFGAKVKGNDYRSIDIGIVTAYITAEAAAQGLSTCILGWLDDSKIREICDLSYPVRLVITLGYAAEGDKLRAKKRKDMDELVSYK